MDKAERKIIREFKERQRKRLSRKMRALGSKKTEAKNAAAKASLPKAREALKKKWQDPEFREHMSKAISRGKRKKAA